MKKMIFVISILTCVSASAKNTFNLNTKIEKLQPKKLSSVLVMQHGELLFESYFNGVKPDDLQDIRSASKTLTGLMYGKAIADGYFKSEKDKVLESFTDYSNLQFPSEQKSNMTFFDLLTMTNPLECDDMNNLSLGHEERMYLRYDWIAFFLNLPARANPPWEPKMSDNEYGRDFAYCTAGISVAAAAIERASGMKFSDYTNRTLFEPLGIENIEWPFNEAGLTQGGGGLKISSRDLLKIGQLVLNKGEWDGEQLIPSGWIDKSLQSYSNAMEELNATYGITFWQLPYPYKDGTVRSFAAAGNGGNYLYIVPELELVTVITATAYNTPYMHRQTHQIFADVILPALLD